MAAETLSSGTHPAATDPAPIFFPGVDGSDGLTIGIGIFLVVSVLAVGLLFLRLHTLPERIAHKRHKLQFEIVAVLGLLALFTHVHLFWVAGLILALIDLPDLSGVFGKISQPLDEIAFNTRQQIRRKGTLRSAPEPLTLNEGQHTKEDLTDA